MKKIAILLIIALGLAAYGCNRDVFVDSPEPGWSEPAPTPDPGPEPEPVFTDSLVLTDFSYIDGTLEVLPETWVQDATTTFRNYTPSPGVAILMDNYNKALVRVSNSTYYVFPWARLQPEITLPGLDSDGVPGFYGDKMPFAFGFSNIHTSLRAGEREEFPLPSNAQVTVVVYTTYRTVKAKADIGYFNTYTPSSVESGWVDVTVAVPVDITAEWGEIIPLP